MRPGAGTMLLQGRSGLACRGRGGRGGQGWQGLYKPRLRSRRSASAKARLRPPSRAGAPSTLHRSVLQQDTGRVWPMPSTSEGTHLMAQDLVTVESPRKGYTVGHVGCWSTRQLQGPHAQPRDPSVGSVPP